METSEFHSREYWRSFAPALHIEDGSLLEDLAYLEMSPTEQEGLAALLKHEGYFQGSADWGLDIKLMADTVRSLSGANLSPVFAYLYDEFWYPFLKMHRLYSALLGGRYWLLPNFWIWNVDPNKGEAGWKPHRDVGRASLFDDGSPKSLTTWIPLSSATPLNGCIYVVPAQYDPVYGTADELKREFELPSIRALPGTPGDFFIWNQAILHWGSRSSPRAEESRISMAFELQRADIPAFNGPLIDPLRILPFEARLRLIAKQIHQYRHMYALDPKIAEMALDLIAHSHLSPPPIGAGGPAARSAVRYPSDPSSWGKVGRNEPCPCDSGKKYKQCHGQQG
jgi:hypothetical protein